MIVPTIEYSSPSAGRDFSAALHDTGFAVLSGHPLPADLLERLYDGWRAFFLGNGQRRFLNSNYVCAGPEYGYFPPEVSETAVGHTARDLKEFYQVVPGCPLPATIAADTFRYFDRAFELGVRLLGWLQDCAPGVALETLSEPLPGMLSPQASLLRILHYPPLRGDERPAALRAAPHEDINLITLLPVSEQPGLQVQDTAGNWIDVSARRGELIINSGDMLQEATRGYFPSTTHRVDNPGDRIANESRISVPFFLTPRADVVLSARYTAASYLAERLELINR